MNNMLTVTAVAEILGVDASQVRRYIRAGRLDATAVTDRLYLVSRAALAKFTPPGLGRPAKNKSNH